MLPGPASPRPPVAMIDSQAVNLCTLTAPVFCGCFWLVSYCGVGLASSHRWRPAAERVPEEWKRQTYSLLSTWVQAIFALATPLTSSSAFDASGKLMQAT